MNSLMLPRRRLLLELLATGCAAIAGCVPLPAVGLPAASLPAGDAALLARELSLTHATAAAPRGAIPPADPRPLGGKWVSGEWVADAVATGAAALEQPSHDRLWRIEQAVLPYAEWHSDGVTIHRVRQSRWRSESDKDVRHTDWQIAWQEIRGVDFVVVPFRDMPLLSHTMLSFRFADGRTLAVSVEARLEHDESYSAMAGAARQYELMYVLGDEPDLLGLRAEVRRDDVYLYETRLSQSDAARLLRNVLERVQQIAAAPEFYDSLTNNCTTNLVNHLERMQLGTVPADWRNRLPGPSDRLAYSLGLLKTSLPLEQAQREAWISSRVRQHLGAEDFSQRIRQNVNSSGARLLDIDGSAGQAIKQVL